ncbi:hypothetical protein BH24ACT7_BH24ACT7_18300 [soil metagenome]
MARLIHGALMAAVIVLAVLPAAIAADQTDTTQPAGSTSTTVPEGPVTLTVTAGLDGRIAHDAPLVVDVELSSQVLVVGTLELDFGGTSMLAVEVPAGGVKEYRMESLRSGRRTSYTVTLRDQAGEEITSFSGRVRVGETELVGILGVEGIDTAIRSARTTPLERTADVVRLEFGQIDGRITPLTYLVAGSGTLGRLSDEARTVVASWVRDGGRLLGTAEDLRLVAEPTGTAVLAGTGVAVTRVGSGELGVVGSPTDMTAEQWSRIIRDTPGTLDLIDSAGQGFDGGLVLAASSGQEAAVPALPWLLGGILLFVVLVGPVNMLVLRAVGRPEWSWLTIPVLSLLFLGGFWVLGRSQILDFTATHASVVVDDGQGTAVADAGLLVQVASAGNHVLALADGWQAYPVGAEFGGSMVEGVVRDRTVVFELEDLGLGSTQVRWGSDGVALEATVDDTAEGLVVSVTNNTGSFLDAWGVVVGGRGFGAGDPLPAGASGSVTVVPGRVAGTDPALVPAAVRTGSDVAYEMVRPLAAHLEATWPVLEEDAAYVFGITGDRTVDVEIDGRTAQGTGTTLLVLRLDLADEALAGLGAVTPQLLAVDGASTIERYGDEIYAYGADSVVFHYSVPSGIPPASINQVTTRLTEIEIYDWEAAEFVPFALERVIDPVRHLSAGGEMLVRASVADENDFMDQSVRLQSFALRWTT